MKTAISGAVVNTITVNDGNWPGVTVRGNSWKQPFRREVTVLPRSACGALREDPVSATSCRSFRKIEWRHKTGCSQCDFARECRQRQKAVIQAPLRWPTAPHINLPFIPNFAADRRLGQNMQAQ